jgi:hypothetical protein
MDKNIKPQPAEIIGADRVIEDGLRRYFEHLRISRSEKRDELEQKMSPEIIEFIEKINQLMGDFFRTLGIDNFVPLPATNVHIIDFENLPESEKNRLRSISPGIDKIWGYYDSLTQQTLILVPFSSDRKLEFLQIFAHEIIHANSFFSLERSKNGDRRSGIDVSVADKLSTKFVPRRDGFSIATPENKYYFNKINEAITEELNILFEEFVRNKFTELEPEFLLREQYIKNKISNGAAEEEIRFALAHVRETRKENGTYSVVVESRGHNDSRVALRSLIDEIHNHMPEMTKEQVFKLFAEAAMTGHLLPVARLVEKVFGKGSFRIIGEATR